MKEIDKVKSNYDYEQILVGEDIEIGVCGVENNLIVKKKQIRNEFFGEIQDVRILSPLDFVYPISKQLCCDSISSEAANLITYIIEFRLRQILEESIKLAFQRGSYSCSNDKNSLPFISFGDVLGAMRYLCGSPNVIWSSEKPLRNYYINAEQVKKPDSVISETNIDIFQALPGRTMNYITCCSYSEKQLDFILRLHDKSGENENFLNDTFHNIVNESIKIPFDNPKVSLHWLAVDGKFVINPENDSEFIKKISTQTNEIILADMHSEDKLIKLDDEIKMSDFGILISKLDNEYLLDDKKSFLNYINSMFMRIINGEYFCWNYTENNASFSVLNHILNTYGLSEKDFNSVTTVISAYESRKFLNDNTENCFRGHGYMDKIVLDCEDFYTTNQIKDVFLQEEREKNEFNSKINDIFKIIENNSDIETLLPYIIYFVYYNTLKISKCFEESGHLPKSGSLRLLIKILTSVVKNKMSRNTSFYLHNIIESLLRIMTMNPKRKVLKSIDSSCISTYCLIDNIYSRYEASKLIEFIIGTCCNNLPLGGARLIHKFSKAFEKLLDNRICHMNNCNCLHIASLYGLVCGIRSLGDISVTSILFPKLLSIFSINPRGYNESVAYIQLHMEISFLLCSTLNLLFNRLEDSKKDNSEEIIFIFWEKLVNNIENIIGDGVLPILLKLSIFQKNSFLSRITKAMCFMDKCIYFDKVDKHILCPDLRKNLSKNYKLVSKQYVDKFLKFYNSKRLKLSENNIYQKIGMETISSMFEVTI
ncbi:hypothetical protein FG386_002245 [Cryptosporidium ryanae]|uniref:uncharacterized protein n=1 Tax=Cryptosporidium ryanae TaxID=515981 RepID=UPI00351A0CF5|nr:hypothetical protein FG386_002245 [Cryptosporidium ryanae]